MNSFLLGLAIFIALLTVASVYRVVRGPSVFDRVLGAGLIGTKTLPLLALVGFLYARIDMFVDIALVYALLNFVGAIVVGKYFEQRSNWLPSVLRAVIDEAETGREILRAKE